LGALAPEGEALQYDPARRFGLEALYGPFTDHRSPTTNHRSATLERGQKQQKNNFPASQMVQIPFNSFIINKYFSKPSTNFVDFMHQIGTFSTLDGPSRL
jgi:hypothetical protein